MEKGEKEVERARKTLANYAAMQNARFTAHNYECTTHREPEFWNYCRVETSATTRVSERERQKHDGEDEKFGRKGRRERERVRERKRNRQKGKEL